VILHDAQHPQFSLNGYGFEPFPVSSNSYGWMPECTRIRMNVHFFIPSNPQTRTEFWHDIQLNTDRNPSSLGCTRTHSCFWSRQIHSLQAPASINLSNPRTRRGALWRPNNLRGTPIPSLGGWALVRPAAGVQGPSLQSATRTSPPSRNPIK
jgi:hypothetical protein